MPLTAASLSTTTTPSPCTSTGRRKERKGRSPSSKLKHTMLRLSTINMRFPSPVSKDRWGKGGRPKGDQSPLARKADNVELIRSISQAGWQSKPTKPPCLPMIRLSEAITLDDQQPTENQTEPQGAIDGLGIQMGNSVEVGTSGGDYGAVVQEKEGAVVVTHTVYVQTEKPDMTSTVIEVPDRTSSKKLRPRISVKIPESRPLSFRRVRRGDSQHYEKEASAGLSVSPPSNPTARSAGPSPRIMVEDISPISPEIPKPHSATVPGSLTVPDLRFFDHSSDWDPSSASSAGRIDDGASSCYSPRSSMSSVDDNHHPSPKPPAASPETVEFTVLSPTAAGVFDDVSPSPKDHTLRRSKLTLSLLKNKPLPPEPSVPVAPLMVGGKPCSRSSSINVSHNRSHSDPIKQLSPISLIPFPSHTSLPPDFSPVDLDTLDEAFRKASPLLFQHENAHIQSPSPTLDEATDALEVHLSAITETASVAWGDLLPEDQSQTTRRLSESMPTRPPPPPPVADSTTSPEPKETTQQIKRKSFNPSKSTEVASSPKEAPSPTLRLGKKTSNAYRRVEPLLEPVTEVPSESSTLDRQYSRMVRQISSDSSAESSSGQSDESVFTKGSTQETVGSSRPLSVDLDSAAAKLQQHVTHSTPLERMISSDAADNIILNLMKKVENLKDLMACAQINRGFYGTFKRNEMTLIKGTLFKMSPAAWELREMSPPAERTDDDSDAPLPEYTLLTYLGNYSGDLYSLTTLKSLILQHCSSFLRRETKSALAGKDSRRSSRLDNAFWRVWTFCRIFGCGKGREDDIVGQMDWLKGGVLAYQQSTGSSVVFTEDFGLNSVLFNPPDGFAKGNGSGLSTDDLYDMTEIWTCLGVLLRGFHGMRTYAREFGIFDNTGIKAGDVVAEEILIEEWTYHLLTLSPNIVLLLASSFSDKSLNPTRDTFNLAKSQDLTTWPAPGPGCSRRLFLKEAVNRVYESKFVTSSSRFVRSPTAATPRRPSHGQDSLLYDRIRHTSMPTTSLPPSELRPSKHQVSRSTPNPLAHTPSSRPNSSRPSVPPLSPPQPTRTPPPPPYSPSSNSSVTPTPSSATRPHPPRARITDPVDVALQTLIHEMGFPEADAKRALADTDRGNALDVNAAIELLVRERGRRRSEGLMRTGGCEREVVSSTNAGAGADGGEGSGRDEEGSL